MFRQLKPSLMEVTEHVRVCSPGGRRLGRSTTRRLSLRPEHRRARTNHRQTHAGSLAGVGPLAAPTLRWSATRRLSRTVAWAIDLRFAEVRLLRALSDQSGDAGQISPSFLHR